MQKLWSHKIQFKATLQYTALIISLVLMAFYNRLTTMGGDEND